MQTEHLIEEIEKIAIPEAAASWDASGLQVASSRTQIKSVAVFLDPVPSIVEQAIQRGAEFLLSHHPLSLKPRLPNAMDAYHEVLRLTLSARVPLYAAHTSLDVNMDGPAGWLGRRLKLGERQVIEKVMAPDTRTGYGEVGNLPQPVPFAQFVEQVLEVLNIKCARWCGPEPKKNISRVAYCGGSGSSLIGLAAAQGADVYITGDIKYHTALDTPLPILDVGHHSIEEQMMREMAELLSKRVCGLNVFFIPSLSPFRLASR